MELTHFDENGNARMVAVGDKEVTKRIAVAEGKIVVCKNVYDAIKNKDLDAEIKIVISNNPDAYAIKRAEEANINTYILKDKYLFFYYSISKYITKLYFLFL